ncbi:hypothetical protein EI94DRAFT_1700001 [Lactarius quietus]|nr:hypothetical protein EI94DRAFT_1700001 [Lactarius quietus]
MAFFVMEGIVWAKVWAGQWDTQLTHSLCCWLIAPYPSPSATATAHGPASGASGSDPYHGYRIPPSPTIPWWLYEVPRWLGIPLPSEGVQTASWPSAVTAAHGPTSLYQVPRWLGIPLSSEGPDGLLSPPPPASAAHRPALTSLGISLPSEGCRRLAVTAAHGPASVRFPAAKAGNCLSIPAFMLTSKIISNDTYFKIISDDTYSNKSWSLKNSEKI